MEYTLTPSMFLWAEHKAKLVGALNHSITAGQGNLVGFLGEILVKEKFGGEIEDSYEYDLIKDGITYDIKTKNTNADPKPHYACSVAEYQNQKCDCYIFTRINLTRKKGWILGWIDKDEFFKKAVLRKKGELDNYGWTVKETCYNIEVRDLNEIHYG